jgi:hypothetical protein
MKLLQSSDLNKVPALAMNPSFSSVSGTTTLPRRAAPPVSRTGSCFPMGLQGTKILGGGTVLWHAGASQTFTAIWGCTAISGLAGADSPAIQFNSVP